MTWLVERRSGSAATFHAREVPDRPGRLVWAFTVDRPALVLGSAQPIDTVDERAATTRGIQLVRRRSGGGAVLLLPGEALWVDVVVPRHDRLWDDDVGRAAWWLGEVWSATLARRGLAGADVHRGGLVAGRWGHVVCFGGLGPGEVTVAGRKAVGLSQRRTRAAARFQCVVHRRWDPSTLVELLAPPRPALDELADLAVEVPVPPDDLLVAFVASLPD